MNDVAELKGLPQIEESVGTELMRAMYEEITQQRIPWIATPEQQQREVIDRLRAKVEMAVQTAVRRLATMGFTHVVAQVESLTIKDEAKAVLLLSRGTEAMHELADNVGSRAVIVFADPADYTDGMHVIKAQADQPALPLDDPDIAA